LQSRFFPACRKFEELSAIADAIDEVETVTKGIHLAPESINTESAPAPASGRLDFLATEPVVQKPENSIEAVSPPVELPIHEPERQQPVLFSTAFPEPELEQCAPDVPPAFIEGETGPCRPALSGLELVVIWEDATSSEELARFIQDTNLWRKLRDLGCRCRRIEIEAIGGNENFIVDERGWRPFVNKTGLPTMLILSSDKTRVFHHCRLPETIDDVIKVVLDTVALTEEE
jgi:hypothetical protein